MSFLPLLRGRCSGQMGLPITVLASGSQEREDRTQESETWVLAGLLLGGPGQVAPPFFPLKNGEPLQMLSQALSRCKTWSSTKLQQRDNLRIRQDLLCVCHLWAVWLCARGLTSLSLISLIINGNNNIYTWGSSFVTRVS